MNIKEIKPKVWINILLITLLLIFILQNLEQHEVKFLFFPSFSLPLFIIIAVSFFIGFYSSYFTGLMRKSRRKSKQEEEVVQKD